MRIRTILALSLAGALLGSIAHGQSMPSTPDSFTNPESLGASQSDTAQKVDGTTSFMLKRPTTANSSSQTSALLSALADDPRLKDVDLSKIEIVGNTTPIQRGATKYVRIDWTSVTNLEHPKKQILAVPLKTELKIQDGEQAIPRDEQVKAEGDLDALVSAVLKVSKATDSPQQQQDAQQSSSVGGGQDQKSSGNSALATPTAAGKTSQNDIAKYVKPTATADTQEVQPLPTGYTTEGCKPHTDTSNQWMIETAALTQGGVKVGNCDDTLNRFAIKARYSNCSAQAHLEDTSSDMPWGYYQAQYIRYYVGADGSPHDIDEACTSNTDTPDLEKQYPIKENLAACGWRVDKSGSSPQAVRQARLEYTTDSDLTGEVDGSCVDSKQVDPIAATKENSSDGYRVDLLGGLVYERVRYSWTVDGATQYSPYEETGTKFTIYKNEDSSVCSWGTNLSTSKAYPQYRKAYNVPGYDQPIFIDAVCQPDLDQATDLLPTTDTCEDTFEDNFAQQESYGTHRYYYMLNGKREFASSCAADTSVVYKHKTRTAKWTNDDVKRSSLAWTETYIETPRGDKVREQATIRPGTPETPYEFVASSEVADVNNTYYEGCDKVTDYINVDSYNRPDGTVYQLATGPGTTPSTRAYVCSASGGIAIADWNKYGKTYSCWVVTTVTGYNGNIPLTESHSEASAYGKYETDHQVIREDNTIISTTHGDETSASAFAHTSWGTGSCNWGGPSSWFNGISMSSVPDHPTQTDVSNWRSKYGW